MYKKSSFLFALLVLLPSLVFAVSPETSRKIIIAIDFIGVVIGVIVLIIILSLIKSLKGSLVNYMMYGMFFQVLALVYTLVFVRFKIYGVPAGIDIHHFLMIIGIIFFGTATYKLKGMFGGLKNK